MKILIGTYDICGWVSLYQKEFIKLGHECDSIVKNHIQPNPSDKYTYDGNRYNFTFKFKSRRMGMAQELFNWVFTETFYEFFVRTRSKKYDLVIYLWDTISPSFKDVRLFRKGGAEVIFLFAGSEVRSFKHFSNQYDVSQWVFPLEWLEEDIERKKKYISTAERYSDQIYSVPDQSGLQKKPYYHISIPIDLEKFKFRNNFRKIPKVLHMPSDPWKKGTDIIETSVRELIDAGIRFEFFTLRNIKHDDIPALLQDMDVVIDEIVFHGPGVLSFEAMASGCAVATRYLETSPSCFRPPVWSIDAGNIKERLIELLGNFDLQQRLIIEGRKYVEDSNDSRKVASNILNNLVNPRGYDYEVSNGTNLRNSEKNV